ncbi:hypothetical protein M876_12420 [Elizabethkingia anophelis FMS-007]|nr:hypothetical protein M876_12420 [Elizabethkingia anophelis FMS-007]EQB92770.1 hypothetical protein C874_17805 [Elizabethkingia anophelis 502]
MKIQSVPEERYLNQGGEYNSNEKSKKAFWIV